MSKPRRKTSRGKPRENSSAEIHKEIEDLWELASTHTGLEAIYDPKFGKLLDQYSRKAEAIASQHLQPWLAILEQAISWLVALHFTLTKGNKPRTEELRVPWALTGAACTQAIAIRKLCLYGLDLPARAVLRSLIETLTVCTITTYDKELRKRFMEPEDFDQAREVWRQHFTEKKVQTKFAEIFQLLGIESEVHNEFRQWQAEEKAAASQAVHPSYVAAALATVPYPVDRYAFQPGVLGSATLFSVRTLAQASKAIWYYSMVGFYLLIRPNPDDGKPLLEPPEDSSERSIIGNGHSVLDQLVRQHWHEDLFPVDEQAKTRPA